MEFSKRIEKIEGRKSIGSASSSRKSTMSQHQACDEDFRTDPLDNVDAGTGSSMLYWIITTGS